jgi:hypothetical protein
MEQEMSASIKVNDGFSALRSSHTVLKHILFGWGFGMRGRDRTCNLTNKISGTKSLTFIESPEISIFQRSPSALTVTMKQQETLI